MSSILTNASAITALQSLRTVQSSLASTQKEISTGLKISSAADNASTWSIAETMKSDQGVLSTISDSLSVSSSVLNVANVAVTNAISVINNIKSAVAQASQPGADLAKIGTSLTGLSDQLKSIVTSANFNGLNLLDGSRSNFNSIASYSDGNGGTASSLNTINLTATALIGGGGTSPAVAAGSGILEAAQATGATSATDFTNLSQTNVSSSSNIADTLSNADKSIADLTKYAAQIGAAQTSVTGQAAFIKTLNDGLTQGVSSLVDADMNQASTRLQALQTQQQLGVQSLSIANQNSQIILRLFQ
ncbi:flagellin N-terminal helical domain-containing protein [Methylosinus sp. LW4]|uniref:flagellin N-terminal helical domain-containing protein n=1 Tax=Methylosinus sp. LW4 TaxID=136993 RepID=UPI00036F0871|nr:flagellin [Methylosinus sp. LW4]